MSGTATPTPTPNPQAELHARAANLLENLLHNPKTARQAEDLIKLVNPDAKFPARDLADSYAAPVIEEAKAATKLAKETADALAADKAERDEQRRISDYTDRLAKAQQKYGFDDKARDAVLQRMKEHNNPDIESAAAYVYDQLPKPPPVNARNTDSYLPSKVDLYGSVTRDEKFKKLHDNPQQYFDDEVRAVLNDPALAE